MFKSIIKNFFLIFLLFNLKSLSAVELNNYAISTSNPIATKIGKKILNEGGNAVDAALAVQMVLNLVEPQSSGIGGGGFMLYFDKKNSNLFFYDGREIAPKNIKKEYFLDQNGNPLDFFDTAVGGLSIGVPGLLAMLEIVHRNHGTKKWSELFVPAINLSKNGFVVSNRLHKLIKKDKYLYLIPKSREYFYDSQNDPIKIGSKLKNLEFANTLRIISKNGAKEFYEGVIAKKTIYTINNSPYRKGVMNMDDLKNYKPKKRAPICKKYREYKICSASLPSAGGISILQILGILENFSLSKKTIESDIHLILEASKYSYNDRYKYLGDSDFNKIEINKLLSKKYLENIASKISLNKKSKLKIEKNMTNFVPLSTTHFSILDKQGNAVSMTSSIENAFGSRLMTGGFLLNNQLNDFNFKIRNNLFKNNIIQPNKRPLSSMSPTIIFDKNNNIKMVIGSPGGKSIIMYVVKTIIAVLDWDMRIHDAVNFPNFTISNDTVFVEKNKFSKKIKNYLSDLEYLIIEKELNSGLNGFEIKYNKIFGTADKRREGLVLYN